MSYDPTGRYQGSNYDPDYKAKQKWRLKPRNSGQHGQEPSYTSYSQSHIGSEPSSPSIGASIRFHRGDASVDRFGPDDGDRYTTSTRGPGNASLHPPRSTQTLGYQDNSRAATSSFQQERSAYSQQPPLYSTRAGGVTERNTGIKMEPVDTHASPSLRQGADDKIIDDKPPAALSNSTTLPPTTASPAAIQSISSGPAPSSSEEPLSSLERLRRFKAQVKASRRSMPSQPEQQQPSSEQLDRVRVAESFLNRPVSVPPSSKAAVGSTPPIAAQHVPDSLVSAPSPFNMPSLPPPSNSAPPVPNEQSLQASQPQDGEDKDIADSREAREQLLREKLRIKMAQRSAGQDANGSHPSSAAPSAREQPPDLADVTISSSTTHPSQEGAEISGPARLDTFSSNSNGHGGHPPDAGYAESRPAHDVSRPASHVARPALNEPPFDPSKSYAEAARQRFASYERNRYMPPRRRTPSPPPRRDPSPRRAVHLSSSRDRGPVSPSVRYERGDPPPEIAERGRADRRVSHSPVVERRLYERSQYAESGPVSPPYPREHVREREFERPAQAVPPSTMPAPPATVVARDDLPPADTNPMETWAIGQIQLLKQQQQGLATAIAELEKTISSGVLQTATSAIRASLSTSTSSVSHPVRVEETRQNYHHEPHTEQRLEPRVLRLDHRLDTYPESRAPPMREQSPAQAPSRTYSDSREPVRQGPPPRSQSYIGANENRSSAPHPFTTGEYGAPRYTLPESHGKAPSYKSHGPYNKQKPYDRRPYVRSPSSRGPSPSRVHYEARSRSSWDGRGPSSTKLDYRY